MGSVTAREAESRGSAGGLTQIGFVVRDELLWFRQVAGARDEVFLGGSYDDRIAIYAS